MRKRLVRIMREADVSDIERDEGRAHDDHAVLCSTACASNQSVVCLVLTARG